MVERRADYPRDEERTELEGFDRLKTELSRPLAAPDSAYQPLDADAAIRRGRQRSDG